MFLNKMIQRLFLFEHFRLQYRITNHSANYIKHSLSLFLPCKFVHKSTRLLDLQWARHSSQSVDGEPQTWSPDSPSCENNT
ncbi:hypothetical protein J4Q44_G00017940 [Coregonus suidteri]|uniref:Uncharacterized protein n=1 Tax=Coregonus suidteri TaxID=861788 RepID=A0AAN8R7F6_9TELE